jgi:hypothetical protein
MKRVKHTRQELRALRKLENAIGHVAHDLDAADLLQAAVIALAYYYESDRARVLRETWSVLRSSTRGEQQ